jgi:hypothetical protein
MLPGLRMKQLLRPLPHKEEAGGWQSNLLMFRFDSEGKTTRTKNGTGRVSFRKLAATMQNSKDQHATMS